MGGALGEGDGDEEASQPDGALGKETERSVRLAGSVTSPADLIG